MNEKASLWERVWIPRFRALKKPDAYLYILAGVLTMIGLWLPPLNFLFYIGLMYPLYRSVQRQLTDYGLFYYFIPYSLVLGIGVWNEIFPWYTGILLALTLPDLFARLGMKGRQCFKSVIGDYIALPLLIYLFDFGMQKLPLLRQIHMIPLLSVIYNHTAVLSTASFFGPHLTLFFVLLFLSILSALVFDILKNLPGRNKVHMAIILTGLLILFIIPNFVGRSQPKASKPVTVAAVQGMVLPTGYFEQDYEALSANLLEGYNKIIGQEKADVFVFPESLTGMYDSSKDFDQPFLQSIRNYAKKKNAYIACWVNESNYRTESEDSKYSSCIFLNPEVVVGVTRKRYLVPFSEDSRFQPGIDFEVYETPYGRMGISICYDTNFDTVERLKKNGAQMILAPFNDTGFGEIYKNIHRYYPVIKAISCNVPVVQANTDGISSLILSNGYVVKELGSGQTGIISHTFDLSDSFSGYMRFGRIIETVVFVLAILLLVYRRKNKATDQ